MPTKVPLMIKRKTPPIVKVSIDGRCAKLNKVADIIGQTNNRLILLSPFTYELTDSMERYLMRHGIKKIDRKIEYVNKEIYQIADTESFKNYFKIRLMVIMKRLRLVLLLQNIPKISVPITARWSRDITLWAAIQCEISIGAI